MCYYKQICPSCKTQLSIENIKREGKNRFHQNQGSIQHPVIRSGHHLQSSMHAETFLKLMNSHYPRESNRLSPDTIF